MRLVEAYASVRDATATINVLFLGTELDWNLPYWSMV